MKLYHEEITDKEKVLFVYSKKTELILRLSNRLKESGLDVFATSSLPGSLSLYKHIFFFEKIPKNIDDLKNIPPYVLITRSHKENIGSKTVFIGHHSNVEDIERIIGFVFSSNNQKLLDLSHSLKRSAVKTKVPLQFRLPKLPRRRKLIGYFIIFFVLFEISFLAPLTIASIFLYKSVGNIRTSNMTQASKDLSIAKPFLDTSEVLYALARPSLSFFSLALLPDSLMSSVQNAYIISRSGIAIEQKTGDFVDLIMITNKTPNQINQARSSLSYLKRDISMLHEATLELSHNLDALPIQAPQTFQEKLETTLLTIGQLEQLSSNFDTLLGSKKAQKYVLFFYNNMELRPGGGFLGSFATVTFQDYTMKDLTVYDVYDADGQLKTHLEPPVAIRDYLEQPHWFLRDSNFSPDFPENVKNAQIFLEKEMGFTNFNGAIGITTTGITNLISAFGSLYVSDYRETVDKNNFYLKTQEHTQTNFFPGSTQKKSFLNALLQTMILRSRDVNKGALGQQLLKSLDEKHIVLYFADKKTQDSIAQAGWNGAILQSECVKNAHCISNSLLSVDANLGVNKANFFVSREFKINTIISQDGTIHNSFITNVHNDSPDNSFGGDYKNFLRVYIPRSAKINGVRVNNKKIINFEEKSTAYFKIVELLVNTKRQHSDVVEVTYTLNQKLKNGKNTYQLALQKQIGSLNTNITMTISLPTNVVATNKNFPAIEKNGSITYNTTLSGNKLFILELNKQ